MSRDPLDTSKRPRRHPGIVALWVIAALIFAVALFLLVRGEQVRSELRQEPVLSQSDQFDS